MDAGDAQGVSPGALSIPRDGVANSGAGTIALPVAPDRVSSSIRQGQTLSYSTAVPVGKTRFTSDLSWGNVATGLTLTIDSPGGTFGPYSDATDGTTDGRILLRITRAGGLPSGTWWSDIYGQTVSGSQAFSHTATVS